MHSVESLDRIIKSVEELKDVFSTELNEYRECVSADIDEDFVKLRLSMGYSTASNRVGPNSIDVTVPYKQSRVFIQGLISILKKYGWQAWEEIHSNLN